MSVVLGTMFKNSILTFLQYLLAGLCFVLLSWMLLDTFVSSSVSAEANKPDAVPAVLSNETIPLPYYSPRQINSVGDGLNRKTTIHTNQAAQPRQEIIKYTVQENDTIFGIAEKFDIRPETVFWGNLYLLGDNVHNLWPDMEINILPQDGVLHRWTEGEGLNGVAKYYGVSPDVIVDWPGNHLTRESVGLYEAPNIEPGTELFVPGGERALISWTAPEITRENPAVASHIGPGFCGKITGGAIGNGTFIYPTVIRVLSGYDYTPETNHFGLDFGGSIGNAIYAVDAGVVVYAGWNDHGYGNMVVIDHGNGWQSLYAHLDNWNVVCGQSVYQGDVIAGLGSTGRSSGPHLHFELRYKGVNVNPWNVLQ